MSRLDYYREMTEMSINDSLESSSYTPSSPIRVTETISEDNHVEMVTIFDLDSIYGVFPARRSAVIYAKLFSILASVNGSNDDPVVTHHANIKQAVTTANAIRNYVAETHRMSNLIVPIKGFIIGRSRLKIKDEDLAQFYTENFQDLPLLIHESLIDDLSHQTTLVNIHDDNGEIVTFRRLTTGKRSPSVIFKTSSVVMYDGIHWIVYIELQDGVDHQFETQDVYHLTSNQVIAIFSDHTIAVQSALNISKDCKRVVVVGGCDLTYERKLNRVCGTTWSRISRAPVTDQIVITDNVLQTIQPRFFQSLVVKNLPELHHEVYHIISALDSEAPRPVSQRNIIQSMLESELPVKQPDTPLASEIAKRLVEELMDQGLVVSGPQGERGPQGLPGPPGKAGPQGEPGLSYDETPCIQAPDSSITVDDDCLDIVETHGYRQVKDISIMELRDNRLDMPISELANQDSDEDPCIMTAEDFANQDTDGEDVPMGMPLSENQDSDEEDMSFPLF